MTRIFLFLVALALLALFPASEASQAATRVKLDRDAGVRFSLDGRWLKAAIVHRPNHTRIPTIESQLLGRRVNVGCGTSFRPPHGSLVFRTVRWPAGARTASFWLSRDISRGAKWCLIEAAGREGGGDLAFVSFLRSEPRRLLAKGRGPSGKWWRVSAWRSAQLEPCLGLRLADDGVSQCFGDDAEIEAKLAAMVLIADCPGDTFVLGATARSATAVTVTLRDGTTAAATLYPRPPGSDVRAQYYVAVLPGISDVAAVESRDAEGRLIGRERYSTESVTEPCGLFIPD